MAKEDRKARIMERAAREKVKFMRLQFTDILGATKNVEVPDRQFDEALDGRIMFDGSSIEGFVRIEESDMYLKPDLDTFQVFPWSYAGSERVGRIICDIANPDGSAFAGCPRSTLNAWRSSPICGRSWWICTSGDAPATPRSCSSRAACATSAARPVRSRR